VAVSQKQLERHPLSGKLAKEARMQFIKLNRADLTGYTYEHQKSHYLNAKQDLFIYDSEGKLSFEGRDFGDRTFFWEPTVLPPGLAAI
jgi:hypothetical protein